MLSVLYFFLFISYSCLLFSFLFISAFFLHTFSCSLFYISYPCYFYSILCKPLFLALLGKESMSLVYCPIFNSIFPFFLSSVYITSILNIFLLFIVYITHFFGHICTKLPSIAQNHNYVNHSTGRNRIANVRQQKNRANA